MLYQKLQQLSSDFRTLPQVSVSPTVSYCSCSLPLFLRLFSIISNVHWRYPFHLLEECRGFDQVKDIRLFQSDSLG